MVLVPEQSRSSVALVPKQRFSSVVLVPEQRCRHEFKDVPLVSGVTHGPFVFTSPWRMFHSLGDVTVANTQAYMLGIYGH